MTIVGVGESVRWGERLRAADEALDTVHMAFYAEARAAGRNVYDEVAHG